MFSVCLYCKDPSYPIPLLPSSFFIHLIIIYIESFYHKANLHERYLRIICVVCIKVWKIFLDILLCTLDIIDFFTLKFMKLKARNGMGKGRVRHFFIK